MTSDPRPEPHAARLLSSQAHALRNHVATTRSVVRLIDDAEIADALDDASRALLIALERAIVLSRVELGERPDAVALELGSLLDLAVRRARREGATIDHDAAGDGAAAIVHVPGPWAERLLADLLHHLAGAPGLATVEGAALVEVPLLDAVPDPLDAALEALAVACGGTLAWDDGFANLRLPLADVVSGE